MAYAPRDLMHTRRLFARFILLVVLPAAGLVSFGVVAISNERAAVEKRFAEEYGFRLRSLAEHLVFALEDAANALGRDAPVPAHPFVHLDFVLDERGLTTSEPLSRDAAEALTAALRAAQPPDGETLFVSVSRGPAAGLYAVRKTGEAIRGLAFAEHRMAASVQHEGRNRFPTDRAAYSLAGPAPTPTPSLNPMRRLLDELTSRPETSPSLPLPGPLSDWRIEAALPGGDPVGRALVRNRTIYVVVLALFYALIAVGVVATLRGIRREVQLSRLKTDFVSNVSHELRTPLTSIRLFAETLQQGRAQSREEEAACLEFIVNESERLSRLTERALDWARIEAGRRQYRPERVRPAELVATTVESFLGRGTVRRGCLTVEAPSDLPEVEVDPGAIGQVLLNLLENAAKYTGEDRRIHVRLLSTGRRVLVEVADNGIGIERKELRRIFDRFYRADDLLARSTEGTGLGLSIARRIVDAHGGRIHVRSTLGMGSTFTVELPAVRSAA